MSKHKLRKPWRVSKTATRAITQLFSPLESCWWWVWGVNCLWCAFTTDIFLGHFFVRILALFMLDHCHGHLLTSACVEFIVHLLYFGVSIVEFFSFSVAEGYTEPQISPNVEMSTVQDKTMSHMKWVSHFLCTHRINFISVSLKKSIYCCDYYNFKSNIPGWHVPSLPWTWAL